MKVSEIYEGAVALLDEDASRTVVYKKNAVKLINQLLAQCLSVENAIRESRGEDKLLNAQRVAGFNDEIVYDTNFVAAAFAYGLAALFCADDDRYMSNALGAEFDRIKREYSVVNFEPVINSYE